MDTLNTEQINIEEQSQENKTNSLDDMLQKQRENWLSEVTKLNEMMQTLPKTDEMMNIIYTTRQKCLETYYAMNAIILKQTREYKKLYNDSFNNIKLNGLNGMRYSSDQAIGRTVETLLEDRKTIIDSLNNHNNYLKDTITSIDNIIYGINQKVKIYEILNGLKF